MNSLWQLMAAQQPYGQQPFNQQAPYIPNPYYNQQGDPANVQIANVASFAAPIAAAGGLTGMNALSAVGTPYGDGIVAQSPYGDVAFPQVQGAVRHGVTNSTNALAAAAPGGTDYVTSIDDNDPRRGVMGTGASTAGYSTQFGFELDGKQRPNKPDQSLLNVLGVAAEQALGKGARAVVYSGKEDEGHQHGSNRHKTGLAADIRVYRPDGSQVKLSDPEALTFATAAAENGARGIGAGSEYMGNSFHIDTVPHADYSAGQGPVWGSWAKQNRALLLKNMGL
jgi:hypothetical protein